MNHQNPLRTLLRDGYSVQLYFLKSFDGVTIILAAIAAMKYRFGSLFQLNDDRYLLAMLAGSLLGLVIFSELGVYRAWRSGQRVPMYGRLLLGWLSTLGALALLMFLSKTGADFSRLWFGAWAAIGLFGLVAVREAMWMALRQLFKRGKGVIRIALVGPEDACLAISARLARSRANGHIVASVQHACSADQGEKFDVSSCISELSDAIEQRRVDEVWLTFPMRHEAIIVSIIEGLEDHVVNIRWVPDLSAYRLINHGVTELAGLPLIDLSVTPIFGINRLVKAVEDRVLAALILALISPLLLVLAVGVKGSSPGPVLYRQRRHGWDGKEIEVWKFRSMKLHTEEHGKVTQARKDDPRVTRFGRFIRKTSLDELPQFFNVLQGSMSIVGPRPHAVAHNEEYKRLIPRYLLRHRVKPGITGWAQVNGLRGETDTVEKMRQRVELDLYYIENWSVWFDLRIIAQTALTVVFQRTAY